MAEIRTLSPMRVARQAVGLVVLALGLVSPAAAAAQSGDPAEGSPSGVIYEIPLDHARQDAAPTRKANRAGGSGGGTSTGADGGAASPIRSENGFGSSSKVPGATSGTADASASGGDKARSRGAGGAGAGGVSSRGDGDGG